MINFKSYDEFTFISELSEKIERQFPNCILHKEYKIGRFRTDIYIENSQQNIVIEVKMLKNYSSLPLSTLSQLEDYKISFKNAKIVLITFSFINYIMLEKLRVMNILIINNPRSFEEIINKIFGSNLM